MSAARPVTDTASAKGIVALSVALVCLVALGGLGSLVYAWRSLNYYEAVQETALAQRTLNTALQRMAAETASATSWNEAYAHVRGPIDLDWVDQHLGVYYSSSFEHDFTLVFDSAGTPIYGSLHGRVAPPPSYQSIAAAAAPLVRDAQRKEFRRRTGVEPPGPAASGNVVWLSAFVRDGGKIHLIGVSTVAPNSGNAAGPAPAVAVATGVTLDARYLTALGDAVNLSRLQLSAAPGETLGSVNLIGPEGRSVGSLLWRVRRPGAEILKGGAGVFAFVALLLGAVIFALGRRIRTLFQRLRQNDAALRSTMNELIAARDKAQASSVAKSRFIANISHEVRTPLNGVLGMAQALSRDNLAAPQAERVKTILRSGEGLLAVLNDVLDISKIEAGHMEVSEIAFDLADLIKGACRSYADVAAAKGLTLSTHLHPSANGRWMGDPARIRQILLNLISNAIKFSERGGVRVMAERQDDMMVIAVEDDGIGVPAGKRDRLFEKFSQVDESSTRRQGGTGLGLAISRELALLMGGDIEAVSTETVGSRFSLRLPLQGALDDQGPALPETIAMIARRPDLRILAAEDNETNRLVLKALLEPLGSELDFVTDGAEAVERFGAGAYDVILMDIQMPVMNGIDATRLIRLKEAREGRPRTPILALTANTLDHHLEEYAQAGMDGVIAKPVQVASLYAAVFASLDDRVTVQVGA